MRYVTEFTNLRNSTNFTLRLLMCHRFVYYITWSLVPGMEPLKCFPNWSPRVWSQPIEPFRSTLPIAYLVKNKQHYKNVTIQHHKNHLTFVSVSYSRDEKWDCCGWSTTDKYSSSNVKNWSKLQSIAVHVPSVVAANLTPALLPVIILEDAELLVDAAVWAH